MGQKVPPTRALLLSAGMAALAGCASVVPKALEEQVDRQVQLDDLQRDPARESPMEVAQAKLELLNYQMRIIPKTSGLLCGWISLGMLSLALDEIRNQQVADPPSAPRSKRKRPPGEACPDGLFRR